MEAKLEEPYEPDGPWIFGKDARYARQTAEKSLLRAESYRHLHNLLDRMDYEAGSSSRLLPVHRHIRELFIRVEGKVCLGVCSYCRVEPIVWLPIIADPRYGIRRAINSVACSRCYGQLADGFSGYFSAIVEAKFSSVMLLIEQRDRDTLMRELKLLFKLPKRVTDETAFEFFWGYSPRKEAIEAVRSKMSRPRRQPQPQSLVLF